MKAKFPLPLSSRKISTKEKFIQDLAEYFSMMLGFAGSKKRRVLREMLNQVQHDKSGMKFNSTTRDADLLWTDYMKKLMMNSERAGHSHEQSQKSLSI